MGAIGSSINIKRESWKGEYGKFTGVIIAHPDRGYNVFVSFFSLSIRSSFAHDQRFLLSGTQGTYRGLSGSATRDRVPFTPYYDSAPVDFATAAKTLQLTYRNTTLLYERQHGKTTGLDALAVRTTSDIPSDPQVAIPSTDDPRLSLDIEGSVEDVDGSYVFSRVTSKLDVHFFFFQIGFGSAMNTVLTSITIHEVWREEANGILPTSTTEKPPLTSNPFSPNLQQDPFVTPRVTVVRHDTSVSDAFQSFSSWIPIYWEQTEVVPSPTSD